MPLALTFGVLSGAGPMAGFYGAIFVGFFAALFGGTSAQISGPTGPTALVMVAVLTHYAYDPGQAFTACAWSTSRSTNSRVEMCVASRTTGGATSAS